MKGANQQLGTCAQVNHSFRGRSDARAVLHFGEGLNTRMLRRGQLEIGLSRLRVAMDSSAFVVGTWIVLADRGGARWVVRFADIGIRFVGPGFGVNG